MNASFILYFSCIENLRQKTLQIQRHSITQNEALLTLSRWSATVQTLDAKSFEAQMMCVQLESKSTDMTPWLQPTSIPLLSAIPERNNKLLVFSVGIIKFQAIYLFKAYQKGSLSIQKHFSRQPYPNRRTFLVAFLDVWPS